MRLRLNGLDSQTAYTTAIRDWLIANGGRPRGKAPRHRRPARRSLASQNQRASAVVFTPTRSEGARR
jgi:hypothetical protein